QELVDLITKAGLIKTVKDLGSCYERLVKEFLVNISEDCNDPMSPEYRKVYVRGRCNEFSADVINQFLGRSTEVVPEMKATYDEICMTLTNNQVRKWPGKIPSVKLTAKYARLNKIVVINWVPTSHTSEHYSEQHPDICTAADVPCKREADLSLDYRLFEGSHAADIAGPSGKK
ncbi:envelope-like protein, partial [Trifolium medium]|nr:envelope-like protein [Trifolium medium]